MTKQMVEIPHGRFLVDVSDEALWLAIQMEFAFRGMPLEAEDSDETFRPLTLPEFYMVASTCPCRRHMEELATAMGFTREGGYQSPPSPV